MGKFVRLFNTVKYLKPIQVYYRLYCFARSRFRKLRGFSYQLTMRSESVPLNLQVSISSYKSRGENTFSFLATNLRRDSLLFVGWAAFFCPPRFKLDGGQKNAAHPTCFARELPHLKLIASFLNLSHTFENNIDWNFPAYGKLWTYNLTYFDYLQQEKMMKADGLLLIHDFISQSKNHRNGLEPFPISLRGISWVKFLTAHSIKDASIDNSLYAQYYILIDNLEYHLLGNHLLENGFSLLFGAYYFQDERLYTKAKEILTAELSEQILDDGAHFELSPMYHQIMLFRLLDCINLLQNNHWKNGELLVLLNEKALLMLGWLNTITFENGSIPLLNDSANRIAPTTSQLNDYANRLNIECNTNITALSDSGYRKIQKEKYECIVDVGNIGPDYIPGHAHSDTFNFELYVNDKPLIVDTGLSTYEKNARRTEERSTAAHNTVEIDGLEQSEVWAGFRVANRAKVVSLQESKDVIKAVHDGYKKRIGALHQREFVFSDNSIRIVDSILSEKEHDAVARLHFHPDVKIKIVDNSIFADDTQIKVENHYADIKTANYHYSPEFNKQFAAVVLEIPFSHKLNIDILL